MRRIALIAALALAGCATTPAGLAKTNVEKTFTSTKTALAWATCVAENTPEAELRSDGTRHWVLVSEFGVPRIRWDFIPTEGGSIVEQRTTAFIGKQSRMVEKCI